MPYGIARREWVNLANGLVFPLCIKKLPFTSRVVQGVKMQVILIQVVEVIRGRGRGGCMVKDMDGS